MKLSIITINYNNNFGLRKTINSVISQTDQSYEWIIIDGGSTDGSFETIKEYEEYITYWVSEKDSGIYNAMNKGIKKASGDYYLFLNSGDSFYDNHVISKFNNYKSSADVLYGNAVVVNQEDEIMSYWHNPENLRLSYFWGHGLNHQSTFMSKRCFIDFSYNETNKIVSDTELFMLLLYNGYSFEKYNEFVARFDNSGVSFTTKYNEYNPMVKRILPKGVLDDYLDVIQLRDVDLAFMIKDIINSNKLVRYLTRLFIYPIHWFIKR